MLRMGLLIRPLNFFCLGIIAITTAQFTTEEPCLVSKQQDIIIVLDSSTSIARPDFQKQLSFVNDLIDNIDIGPDANQVGIISFSTGFRLNFHLNANREKAQLQKRVSEIKQMGGNTYTNKPLEYIKKNMFTAQRGDRPDKDNVCVVITDGQSSDPEKTAQAARALAGDGVEMFALGVGPKVDRGELITIAGDSSRVFQATSYDELDDISTLFSETALGVCPPEATTTPLFTIPPPVITGMTNEPVEVGNEISLRCSSETEDPDTELYWYREGVQMRGTSYSIENGFVVSYYKFDAELGDDLKSIECVLKHPLLENDLMDSVALNVILVPGVPVITYNPGDTVYDGDLLTLACVSETQDPTKTDVIWKVQGKVLEGERLVGSETVTNNLALQAALTDNSVRYVCEVIHPNIPEPLVAYGRINVKPLPGPPIITSNPESPVEIGSRVSLTCTSDGTDIDTKVIWYRDDRVVDQSFSISGGQVRNELSVTVPSSREYECRVVHPRIDEQISFYNLDVYKTPEKPIIRVPANPSPNTPITLDCTSQNADELARLVWIKDGSTIDESYELDGSVISNSHTFSSIADVKGSRCEVTHKYLPAPTYAIPNPIVVVVLPGPPVINNGDPIETATIGSRIVLTCASLGTEADTTVTWYKSGSLVGRSYFIQGDSVVNTINVRAADDQSIYECRVSHPQLQRDLVTSTIIPIMILPEPPVISGVPTSPIIPGTSLTLTCQSRGTSRATQLVWYKDGEEVDRSYQVSGDFVVNEYKMTATEDGSDLECRLFFPPSGLQMSDRENIRAQVLPGPPVIVGNPQLPVSIGSKVSVFCLSNGTVPGSRLTWYRQNRQVDISFGPNGDQMRNDYEYTVKTEASETLECRLDYAPAGLTLTTSVVITKQGRPGKPEINGVPDDDVGPGVRVNLTCQSLGTSEQTKLLWFKNGREVDSSYGVVDRYVVNRYDYMTMLADSTPIECRLEYQPLSIRESAFAVVPVLGIPGPPEISGVPSDLVQPGSVIYLQCRSFGTYNGTELVWYKDGVRVDSSYYTSTDFVINDYEFVSPSSGDSNLECRLYYSATGYESTVTAQVRVQDVPGPITITGAPGTAQVPGTLVQLICRSRGTSPSTRLVWFLDGNMVDNSYGVDGDYISNVYNYKVPSSGSARLECRLEFPPTNLRLLEFLTIAALDLPGDPTITGTPASSVVEGTLVRLVCASRGTSPSTKLYWYKDNQIIDNSHYILDGYVVNDYEFRASGVGLSKLECRMSFAPANLEKSDYADTYVRAPDSPEIDQQPSPVWEDDSVTLICRVRHNGNVGMNLEWYERGRAVDQTQYIDGDYIINKYNLIATQDNRDYSCRLSYGLERIEVPHRINLYRPYPHPIVSGSPSNAVRPGDRFNITCTWPRLVNSASLYWLNAITKEVLPSTAEEYDPDKFVIVYTATANAAGLNVYDCLVRGVTTGKDNDTLVDRVKVPVVDQTPQPDCSEGGAQLDLIVILDSSSSLTRTAFQQQIDFLNSFVSAFDVGPSNVQVGVVSFSNNDQVEFYMNEYNNKADLQAAISEIKQIGGGTNTHVPIRRTREEMFTARYGDRPDVSNLCVVLTDGRSYDPAETALEAELAREAKIEIYALGVGKGVDFEELTAIAGDQSRVYFAENYSTLETIEQDIVSDAKVSVGPCPGPTPTQITSWTEWSACSKTCGAGVHTRTRTCVEGTDKVQCPKELSQSRECIEKVCEDVPQDCLSLSHQADIAFLLDTSSSVYEPDFDKMKLFLADFIDLFNVSMTQQKIASLTFSDDVRVNFHLNDYDSNEDVKAAILRIPMHLGGTRTAEAIRFARQELFTEVNGARINSAKLAFVITDGKSYDPEQTIIEAELARRSGIRMYSVGIGPETDQAELERIAGKIEQVFYVATYDDINSLKRKIGVELGRCYNPLAPVDGGYGPWGPYEECSVTCGVGTTTRYRVCDSPVPRNGGKDCQGPSFRTKRCKLPRCCPAEGCDPPIPQGWTDWEFYSSCSVTCGEGVQEVTRYCQYEDGCILGQVERKTIKCQLESCQAPAANEQCGGDDGLNVMFASQGINSNGLNSYLAVELIANATASLPVDGNRIRTSLTLSDCTCGKNTGYDLSRYRNFEDIYNHLHDLDLGDTASLLRKVKSDNDVMPSMSRNRAFSDNRRQVLVYMFDSNDVITEQAVAEANKLKMAGVTIYATVLHKDINLKRVSQIVSMPEVEHILIVGSKEDGDAYVSKLYEKLCRTPRL